MEQEFVIYDPDIDDHLCFNQAGMCNSICSLCGEEVHFDEWHERHRNGACIENRERLSVVDRAAKIVAGLELK